MMPAVPRVVRRIVVGIDASNASVEALRAAARVAAARGAELLGIYVEDDQLIRLASLPVAREVCMVSGSRRALAGPGMERALRMVATRARRALEVVADRARVPWRFVVARGIVAEELLKAAGEAELVVLGRASRVAGRLHVGATARAVLRGASRPVLLLRRPLGSRGAVVAAAPAPGEGDAALQAAVAWAQALDAPLVALARPGGEAAETDRALAALGAHGRIRLWTQDVPRAAALVETVRSERGELLVLDVTRDVHDGAELQQILCETDVSLLLVR